LQARKIVLRKGKESDSIRTSRREKSGSTKKELLGGARRPKKEAPRGKKGPVFRTMEKDVAACRNSVGSGGLEILAPP